jgi:hypothetical protein
MLKSEEITMLKRYLSKLKSKKEKGNAILSVVALGAITSIMIANMNSDFKQLFRAQSDSFARDEAKFIQDQIRAQVGEKDSQACQQMVAKCKSLANGGWPQKPVFVNLLNASGEIILRSNSVDGNTNLNPSGKEIAVTHNRARSYCAHDGVRVQRKPIQIKGSQDYWPELFPGVLCNKPGVGGRTNDIEANVNESVVLSGAMHLKKGRDHLGTKSTNGEIRFWPLGSKTMFTLSTATSRKSDDGECSIFVWAFEANSGKRIWERGIPSFDHTPFFQTETHDDGHWGIFGQSRTITFPTRKGVEVRIIVGTPNGDCWYAHPDKVGSNEWVPMIYSIERLP